MYVTKLIRHTISYCVEKKDLALIPNCIFCRTNQRLQSCFAKTASNDPLRNLQIYRGQVLIEDAAEGQDYDCT